MVQWPSPAARGRSIEMAESAGQWRAVVVATLIELEEVLLVTAAATSARGLSFSAGVTALRLKSKRSE